MEAGTRQAARLERQGAREAAGALLERIATHVEKIREGIYFEGIEQYKPYFYPRLATLLDYVVKGSVVYDDPVRLKEHYSAMIKDVGESQALLLEKGRILPSQAKVYADWTELAEVARPEKVLLSTLDKRVPGMQPDRVVHVHARSPEPFHGKMDRLASSTRKWRQERFRVCLVLSTPERGERIVEAFKDEGLDAVYVNHLNGELKAGNIVVTTGALETGAEFPDSKLVVLTDLEVFGRTKRRRTTRKSDGSGARIAHFADLKEGDYVVHTNHGIGKYLGVETLEIAGVHKDYLVVQYAGEDKLYVPTDQVDLLQRYIGMESPGSQTQ